MQVTCMIFLKCHYTHSTSIKSLTVISPVKSVTSQQATEIASFSASRSSDGCV